MPGLMLCLAVSCSKSPAGAARPARPPVPVVTAESSTRDVPVQIQAIGNVQAYSLVLIRSLLTGQLESVNIREGQDVRAGDLLFTLDPRPWQTAVNEAQANLARDEAQCIRARLEFERTSNLFETQIASKQDFDSALAAYRGLEASIEADAAALSNAQVNLGYTSIRAPIDGRTGNLSVRKGNVVKSPDDVLLRITQVHPVYVAFSVPEAELPAIRREARQRALPVTAAAPGDDGVATGELTLIDNLVDTNTGSILLKATFANQDEVLWPGQYVRVTLTLSNLVDAVVVPTPAVQTGQSGQFVFVVKPDKTVETRPVVVGLSYGNETVILRGLSGGETVVTDGQLRLSPGAAVIVKSPGTPGTNSPAPVP